MSRTQDYERGPQANRPDFSRPPASQSVPTESGSTESTAVLENPVAATPATVDPAPPLTLPIIKDGKPVCQWCGYAGVGAMWMVPGKGPDPSCARCGHSLNTSPPAPTA